MVSALIIPILLAISAHEPGTEAGDPFEVALIAAVHRFAEDGKLAHVQAIIDKYPKLLEARRAQELGKPSHGDGYTLLQTAARHGRDEVVGFLIRKGAEVNAADGYGYAPLHLAAEGGHLDVVKRLVRAGARVEAKTKALPGGFVPGPPANEPTQNYEAIPARTALQIALDQKHTDVAKFLKATR